MIGYGVVVGLRNTGDKQQTIFTTQMLGNILQHMGVQIPSGTVIVKNVAAVFVTANLPPFASPGTQLDVTVSSAGDARSLEGGLLLLTPLYGADGQVYAAAQGPLILGGYSEGTNANSKQVNHPTVGRIPGGGLVERDSSLDLRKLDKLSLLLNEPNFTTAEEVAGAINREFGKEITAVIDSRRVEHRHRRTGSRESSRVDGASREPDGGSSSSRAGGGERAHRNGRDGQRCAPGRGFHFARQPGD